MLPFLRGREEHLRVCRAARLSATSPTFDPIATVRTARLFRAAGAACACLGGLGFLPMIAASREPWETGETAANILAAKQQWPASFPLTSAHLKRVDESVDTMFYAQPRLVHHIDEQAIATLQRHYRETLPKGGAVLDLMSSWTSHLAKGSGQSKEDGWFSRVSALGMNAAELEHNPALHDFHVADLNADPSLRFYADESFDAVFCSVSVDYLSQPLKVFEEIHRVLKPGGIAIFTWSNRMFPTKAISAWRMACVLQPRSFDVEGCPKPTLPLSPRHPCKHRISSHASTVRSPRGCGSSALTFTTACLVASGRRGVSTSRRLPAAPTPCRPLPPPPPKGGRVG